MDTLFRFEMEESFFINSFCIRADSFVDAISRVNLVLGDNVLRHVISIHKIN